jgi:V/A-type H+-transporting ATPase subunit K
MTEFVAEHINGMVEYLFLTTGMGTAGIGAILAVGLACVGSARGISVGASQAAGILSEKPELFGKLFILMSLPGTQGFYGLVAAVMIAMRSGIMNPEAIVGPMAGLALLFVGIGMGIAEWRSASFQGDTCAACINWTSKRPEDAGRALILPVLVETYGVVALLAAILMILWLTSSDLMLPAMPVPGA